MTLLAALTTLDTLVERTRSYRQSAEYLETLRFVGQMRRFSPYNAYLLRIQRPYLRYAASMAEWEDFGRRLKVLPEPRPLVVLRPFGPVDFVYDLDDTEGRPLPESVLNPFRAKGFVGREQWDLLLTNARRRGIEVTFVRASLKEAGSVTRLDPQAQESGWLFGTEPDPQPRTEQGDLLPEVRFQLKLNSRLDRTAQYVTLLHELAHVACGHLGAVTDDDWPDRGRFSTEIEEFEAESVAFLVSTRLGLDSNSEAYLIDYVDEWDEIPRISINTVLTAAWLLEEWCTRLTRPKKAARRVGSKKAASRIA